MDLILSGVFIVCLWLPWAQGGEGHSWDFFSIQRPEHHAGFLGRCQPGLAEERGSLCCDGKMECLEETQEEENGIHVARA